MKNKLVDLNNHLFEQLERLNDDDLSGAELEREMKRSRAMAGIASNIVANAQLAILETEMVTKRNLAAQFTSCMKIINFC